MTVQFFRHLCICMYTVSFPILPCLRYKMGVSPSQKSEGCDRASSGGTRLEILYDLLYVEHMLCYHSTADTFNVHVSLVYLYFILKINTIK